MTEFEDFTATLKSLGVIEVCAMLSQGVWANRRKSWATDWLQQEERSAASGQVAAGLSIAAQDASSSREANAGRPGSHSGEG